MVKDFRVMLLAMMAVCAGLRGADFQINAIDKNEIGKKSTGVGTSMWENNSFYRISVKNDSLQSDAKDLTLNYRIYVVRDTGNNNLREAAAKPEKISGSLAIPIIDRGKSVSIDTPIVKLKCLAVTNGGYYVDGSRAFRADKLRGIWLQLVSADKVVGEYLSLPSLKKLGPF